MLLFSIYYESFEGKIVDLVVECQLCNTLEEVNYLDLLQSGLKPECEAESTWVTFLNQLC